MKAILCYDLTCANNFVSVFFLCIFNNALSNSLCWRLWRIYICGIYFWNFPSSSISFIYYYFKNFLESNSVWKYCLSCKLSFCNFWFSYCFHALFDRQEIYKIATVIARSLHRDDEAILFASNSIFFCTYFCFFQNFLV